VEERQVEPGEVRALLRDCFSLEIPQGDARSIEA
jgi:hypothetical protein